MKKSYTETLADFAAAMSVDDLTEEALCATKRLILDTIGCSVGGYTSTIGKIVTEIKRELGGRPESTLMVVGDRTSCTSAAYVNAEMAMSMDADDTFTWSGHHANCAVLPALAVAERVGASGKQLVEAVALGYDIAARIGFSLRLTVADTGTGTIDYAPTSGMSWIIFGAAVAAGKLLGLDEERMAEAMGLAGFTTSVPIIGKGRGKKRAPRPMTKWALAGTMAESGVMAALLARKGFTADRTVLDGEYGFWRMVGAFSCNWDFLTADLGKRWFIEETSFKPYPCCRFIHAPLDAFYKLLRENQLEPEDIDQVNVHAFSLLNNFEEPTVRNEVDTQFNVPHVFAMAAFGVAPGPKWQSPDTWHDPKVEAFKQKVKIHANPACDASVAKQQMEGVWKRLPAAVEVKAKGQTFGAEAEYAWGDPWTPDTRMTDDEMKEKFRNMAFGLLRPDRIEMAIDTIYNLDKIGCVDELVDCLK